MSLPAEHRAVLVAQSVVQLSLHSPGEFVVQPWASQRSAKRLRAEMRTNAGELELR